MLFQLEYLGNIFYANLLTASGLWESVKTNLMLFIVNIF